MASGSKRLGMQVGGLIVCALAALVFAYGATDGGGMLEVDGSNLLALVLGVVALVLVVKGGAAGGAGLLHAAGALLWMAGVAMALRFFSSSIDADGTYWYQGRELLAFGLPLLGVSLGIPLAIAGDRLVQRNERMKGEHA